MTTQTVTIAKGDGIGPEIMEATLRILKAAGARLQYDEISIGEQEYLAGNTSGIAPESWEKIIENRVFLKAPITTPQGGGYKSLNVTIRKSLNLFANVRPCFSLSPFVVTKHPALDIVIVRENEEDLYAGIEHQQTAEVVQCLKLISRPGCEKIVRYAFEYAKQHKRAKVTCMTKANIMKQTDGLFKQVFQEIATEYPDIASDHFIVDIGTARLADTPEAFDVVVVPNLYGDIISDVVAQITGSVGMAGSANIGSEMAMFEAIHGSAPDIAGKNIANPSGLLNGAIMMLNHLQQTDVAAKIANAWLKTMEDGVHTADNFAEGISTAKVGTKEFADAVIERLGQLPSKLQPVKEAVAEKIVLPVYKRRPAVEKRLKGVDIFVDWAGANTEELATLLKKIENGGPKLSMITNRGVKVWPNGFDETFCTDHWRCRFDVPEETAASKEDILHLLTNAVRSGVDVIKTENLYEFDGQKAYSLGQGQ